MRPHACWERKKQRGQIWKGSPFHRALGKKSKKFNLDLGPADVYGCIDWKNQLDSRCAISYKIRPGDGDVEGISVEVLTDTTGMEGVSLDQPKLRSQGTGRKKGVHEWD